MGNEIKDTIGYCVHCETRITEDHAQDDGSALFICPGCKHSSFVLKTERSKESGRH